MILKRVKQQVMKQQQQQQQQQQIMVKLVLLQNVYHFHWKKCLNEIKKNKKRFQK